MRSTPWIRTDEVVDFFDSLDKRVRYFDAAVNKDPDNPYVRQHYARMLMRSQREHLALTQMEAPAISLNANILALHHTKGLVLTQLALRSPSMDIGRRFLAQAEDSFKTCMRLDPRDDYGYQSLAHLYLEWAKRCTDSDEIVSYIDRAEAAVSEGLRRARRHEALWLESARIEEFLQDAPARIFRA